MKRRVLLILGVGVAATATLMILARHDPEPCYKGKPLDYWLMQSMRPVNGISPEQVAFAEAVKTIGEPAVPFLIRKTRYHDGFLKAKWIQFQPHLPAFAQRRFFPQHSEEYVRAAAYEGFRIMGPQAKSGLPELIKAFHYPPKDRASEDHILRSLWVFQEMGSQAKDVVPYITSVISGELNPNKTEFLKADAIRALQRIGPSAKAALPLLLTEIDKGDERSPVAAALAVWSIDGQTNLALRVLESALEDSDGNTVVVAIKALEEIKMPVEMVVPKFIRLLNRPESSVKIEAAWALRGKGPAASTAVPGLVQLLQDEDTLVQGAAEWTLRDIRPAPEATIRAFSETLLDSKEKKGRRAEMARYLGELGSEASGAVPSLIEALTDRHGIVRIHGALALWQIDHRHLEISLPILVELLRAADEFAVYRAVVSLENMGSAANAAVPALEAVLHRRFDTQIKEQVKEALETIKGAQNVPR